MSTAVTRLDEYLKSTLDLKPPGITGSKIQYIARLCTLNIKEESDLIQRISDHFESAPATHKLGVLYVIDFIARCWIAHTRKFGRYPPNTAPDGTLAGGVDRITKLLPVLMTGIVNHAPLNHKEKIEKLLEIWEEQKSFPSCMLDSFRKKVDALSNRAKSPPQPARVIVTARIDRNSDQELAGIDETEEVTPAMPTDPSPILPLNPMVDSRPLPRLLTDNCTGIGATHSLPATIGSVLQKGPALHPSSQMATPCSYTQIHPLSPTRSLTTKHTAPLDQPELLQLLSQWAMFQDQRAAIVESKPEARCTAQSLQLPRPSPSFGKNIVDSNSTRWRRRGKYKGGKQPHYRLCPPDRQLSRIYQGSISDKRQQLADEPLVPSASDRSSCSSSPQRQSHLAPWSQPKLMEWDYSICPGNIKVFSRTLFIKGDFSEELIRSHIEKFGAIQSCIIDKFKHHAFVKMFSRTDAVSAHKGFYLSSSDKMHLQVKWGIGFGPRDCCDYENGISIIPIGRLTNADCTWLLTAEYGGTGDLPIQEGMAVEEPDIELGTGIASKVISRRIAAGPIRKSLKSGRVGRGGGRTRRRGRLTSTVKGAF